MATLTDGSGGLAFRARELRLPELGAMSGVAIGAMSTGAIQTVRMDSLRVGNASAYDITACRLDLAPLRRVLRLTAPRE